MLYGSVAVFLAVWLLTLAAFGSDPHYGPVALEWSRTPVLLFAVPLALVVAMRARESRMRWAWAFLASGYFSVVIGDTLGAIAHYRTGHSPAVSISDVFWIGYFPLAMTGVLCLPRIFRSPLDRARFVLDALIVTTGGGLLVWFLALRPLLGDGYSGEVPAWIAMTYPIGDLLSVFAMALVLTRLPRSNLRAAHLALAISFAASLAGDLVWAMGVSANGASNGKLVPTIFWNIWAVAFLIGAALTYRVNMRGGETTTREARTSWGGLAYGALLFGYALTAALAFGDDLDAVRGSVVGATAMTMLVVARLLITQFENSQLLQENARRAGEARFAALVEHAAEAIVVVDEHARIDYASPAANKLMGASGNPSGGAFTQYVHPDDALGLMQYVDACARDACRTAVLILRFSSGTNAWLTAECTISNLLRDRSVGGIVLNLRDISERQALEDQMRFQAFHDALTGLPNRELFLDRVERALTRARTAHVNIAVAVIDLDRYKSVNDAIGHRNADHALLNLAQRLEQGMVGSDSLARYGGDEFALLMEDVTDADDAVARAQRLRATVAAPIVVGGKRVALTASVGVAVSDGSARGAEALLRDADLALQQAQSGGGDGCELFEAERHVRTLERLSLEAELPQLIEREAFAVSFQPVLTLPERRVSALYVRLGWREPERAATPIPALLAAAAESGQGVMLGQWLREACARDLAALGRCLPEAARLTVIMRVDPRELREADFCDRLAASIRSADLSPRQLVLKLPAAAFAGAGPGRLEAIAALGVRIGLSDFGAGNAGLELLDAAPLSALFLSRSLVQRLDAGARPGALTRVAVAAGRALDATVIAPGVSTAAQLARLAELRCDLAYGDGLAPALPFTSLLPWLGARFAEAAETEVGATGG